MINYIEHIKEKTKCCTKQIIKKIIVEDTTIDFLAIYKEQYFPQDLLNEISKANMLIIPDFFQEKVIRDICFRKQHKSF